MAEDSRRSRDYEYIASSPLSPPANSSGSTPISPAKDGPSYQRLIGAPSPEEFGRPRIQTIQEGQAFAQSFTIPQSQGLGINPTSPGEALGSREPLPRVAVGSRPSAPRTPSSAETFSPQSHNRTYSATTAYDPSERYGLGGLGDDDVAPNRYGRRQQTNQPLPGQFERSTEQLNPGGATESIMSRQSKRSKYDNDFQPHACPSRQDFYQGATNWLAITILMLSIFSTVLSGAYLIIAIRAPRYGRGIQSRGSMTASTANVITQLFAKLIELSFVTTFVTFLGQVLSRRAFSPDPRGITLAEMSMRNWIMQPGSMITHYESVRFAALTFLGAISLTVAILAMLYSTAASALVTPVLKFGPWEDRLLYGVVKASYANSIYLANNCKTPIQVSSWDPDYAAKVVGPTCLTLENAAQGFNNYQQYMTDWTQVAQSGNGTDVQMYRPPGVGLFLQNTTVNGSWIHVIDTKILSKQYNRVINNVTLAFPHVGVFQAARDPKSNILQPEDLDGVGTYNIRAALPSPYINVMCANVAKDEIKDLVYETAVNQPLNPTTDLPTAYTTLFNWTTLGTLQTPIDDVFGWEPQYRPVFYKYPIAFNTLLNSTGTWGSDSVYLLGFGGTLMNTTVNNEYFLCKAKGGLTPVCSTEYTVGGGGGQLTAHCEDKNDQMAYNKANSSRIETTSLDWYNVATTAFESLSLNNGVTDGNASNARVLTELMLQQGELNPALPSPAEAIAVMIGNTLINGAQDSPFVEFWNYSATSLEGEYQAFNVSIQAQEYASGGIAGYQRGFVLVLFAVFITNIFVLIYLIVNKGLVTDFSEPPNLFGITINSPPNPLMRGSCGAGPDSRQYAIKWGVEREGNHLYISDKDQNAHPVYGNLKGSSRTESFFSFGAFFGRGKKWNPLPSQAEGIEMGASTPYSTQGGGTTERTPEMDMEDGLGNQRSKESNLSRVYSMISKRRSVL